MTPVWQIGANGYLYKQTTDDEVDGNVVSNGGKRAAAIGPFIRYHRSVDWDIVFKCQHGGEPPKRQPVFSTTYAEALVTAGGCLSFCGR
jgi:hypothetical protein